MAKILNINTLRNKVSSTIANKAVSGPLLQEIGAFVRERIYQTTKKGKSLITKDKIKSLSEGYVKYRKRYEEWEQTGDFFLPKRSNLTMTGQMLKALAYEVKRFGSYYSRIEVFVKDSMRRAAPQIPQKSWVKGNSDKKFRKLTKPPEDLTNAEVAARVAKEGRPFIGLDATGANRVKLMVVNELRKRLREAGLKK